MQYHYLYQISNPSNIIAGGYITFLDVNGLPTYDTSKYAVGTTDNPASLNIPNMVTLTPSKLQQCIAQVAPLPSNVKAAFVSEITNVYTLLSQGDTETSLALVQNITLSGTYSQYQSTLDQIMSILQS